jgi:hypothetical protein
MQDQATKKSKTHAMMEDQASRSTMPYWDGASLLPMSCGWVGSMAAILEENKLRLMF